MTDFATSVERLHNQVRHWEQPRWKGKAEQMYALVQHLADLGADAEGQPRRVVPREHDMILPDQLRVVADDLLAAAPAPEALAEATEAVDRTRRGM
ncbi:hypothetical protein GCM10010172_12850 [Paractinoplanes ferrugineus]|uniref:Uncharacterized protein n=1 Tax=Paractinoplanes ferrugineus TaxID=113564 RepID=A0A919IVS5_9ACTN|nr:hypothetical protein [Actinoplanes ferrugineus]GIE09850.1 hypothetical protein Afe05nite_16900 [Actinoplanes ferrugineus]